MSYICFIIIGLIIVLNLIGLIYLRARSIKTRGFMLPAAAMISDACHAAGARLAPRSEEEGLSYYDVIYVGERAEDVRREKESGLISVILLILFAGALGYLFMYFNSESSKEYITELKRPKSGSEEIALRAEYEDEEIDLSVSLSEARPDEEGVKKLLELVKERIEEDILLDNPSFDDVRSDIFLPSGYGENIGIYWSISDADVIAYDGRVASDLIDRKRRVLLTAHIECYGMSDTEEYELTVRPLNDSTETKASLLSDINALLDEADGDEVIELPDEFMGSDIRFRIYREDNSMLLCFLFFFAAVLILPYGGQLKRQKRAERNAQLMMDFPEVAVKLSLLLESGLSVRQAFERTALDYERRKDRGRGKRRYVYEEMQRARNELQLGVSEALAYESFGRRCGNMYYIRLASLLAQNTKRGGESLLITLRQEIAEARNEKQTEIRKRGEACGMKLLIPMAGMFALVLAVILVPSFLSM